MNAQPMHHNVVNLPPTIFRQTREEINQFLKNSLPEKFLVSKIFESVWNYAEDGMRLTNSDGIILAVNDAFCKMVGKTQKELLGKELTVVLDPSVGFERMMNAYHERIVNKAFKERHDRCYILHNYKVLEVEVITTAIEDDRGEVMILSEFRDISERIKRERSLVESEFRYRSLFQQSVLPMYQSSLDGDLLNANSAFIKLLGYSSFYDVEHMVLGKDLYVNEAEREAVKEILLRDEKISGFEVQLKKRNGDIITVHLYSRILKDEQNTILGFEGTIHDITERKQLEEKVQVNIKQLEDSKDSLTKLNAQKDKMVSVISHDLRSPFCSILGFCELLVNDHDTLEKEEKIQYLGYIKDAAQYQLDLMNSLLDWSKLETGRVNIVFEDLEAQSLITSVSHTILGVAKSKNVELHNEIPPGTMFRGDKQLMLQLFSNLISNALKFTPEKGNVTISVYQQTSDHLVIAVHDTGIGIPSDDISRLFKIEEKYTRKGLHGESGTGLGLPMCYEIVKKHNGSITVESVEGQGTTFLITFPIQKKGVLNKILIVDDQEGNRVLLNRYLNKIVPDCAVLEASDGNEALMMVENEHPELIITDYNMPEKNGLDFVRAVRENPKTKNIPVIIVSGDYFEASSHQFILTRNTHILQKPISYTKLQETIHFITP